MGGVLILLILSMIGAGNRVANNSPGSQVSVVGGNPTAMPVSSASAPVASIFASPESTATPKAEVSSFLDGKFVYSLPAGYRVASKIVSMDAKNSPKIFSVLTITKGTEKQENDYVSLVKQIQGGEEIPSANELPQFLPGKTITILTTSKNAEDSDAKLSKGQEKITTSQGNSGMRYIRVEGSTPYDVVYLKLSEGRLVSVQMSYGSEEPVFDETAFMAVVNSIK